MKNIMTAKILMLSLLIAPVAFAQETNESAPAGDGSDVRPAMPSFFFTEEQRRVLEAVRQGVLEKEVFEVETFIPSLIIEQALLPDEEAPINEEITRPESIQVNAFVRNRATGKSSIWVNGDEIIIGKDQDKIGRKGIEIDEESVAEGYSIEGIDKYQNTRFQLKVGQIIGVDGNIEESLPVIVKNQ